MVKAKEFWQYLCEGLNYRFFAGVPHINLKPLYDGMSSEIMHYIPAVRESTALGIVSGAYLAGVKGGIFLYVEEFEDLLKWLRRFNLKNKIPLLIFVYDDKDDNIGFYDILSSYKIPYIFLKDNFEKRLKEISDKSEKLSIPGVVIIKGGVLNK
jgi:sulfopyruvate decarboxylase TPP-binding subunit